MVSTERTIVLPTGLSPKRRVFSVHTCRPRFRKRSKATDEVHVFVSIFPLSLGFLQSLVLRHATLQSAADFQLWRIGYISPTCGPSLRSSIHDLAGRVDHQAAGSAYHVILMSCNLSVSLSSTRGFAIISYTDEAAASFGVRLTSKSYLGSGHCPQFRAPLRVQTNARRRRQPHHSSCICEVHSIPTNFLAAENFSLWLAPQLVAAIKTESRRQSHPTC